MKNYNYAIIKNNYPELERETVLDPITGNKYNSKKKYAIIVKGVFKDGSEGIYFIKYDNNLEKLHNMAKGYKSWYNYPLDLAKHINGNIVELD